MSEIADAIHADAEAARAEIRAAGIVCPSCDLNMADLPKDHRLLFNGEGGPAAFAAAIPNGTVKCASGESRSLLVATYEEIKAAANITIWNEVNAALDAEFSKAPGWDINGPAPEPKPFTGLLGML